MNPAPFPQPQLAGDRGLPVDHSPSSARAGNGPWWLWVLTLILLVCVVFKQRPAPASPDYPAKAAAGTLNYPVFAIEYTLPAKIYFGIKDLSPDPQLPMMLQESADVAAGFQHLWPAKPSLMPAPAPIEQPPAHARLYAAILAADTLGNDAAITRLDLLAPQLAPESPLVADVALLRKIYADGALPAPDIAAAMDPDAREAFEKRHGLFARLALSYGNDSDPARLDATSSGLAIILLFMLFGGGFGVAMLIGFVMLIYFIVLLAQGRVRRRFVPPGLSRAEFAEGAAGQGLWLETVAVFLAGFLAMGLIGDALSNAGAGVGAAYFSLVAQWSLLLIIFWPMFRGMSRQQWCGEIGWHRGRGVLAEMGAGMAVYLACLPVYFFVAFILVMLMLLWSALTGSEPARPLDDNKVFELATSGSPILMVLVFFLATLWAPIVEESIFRGALYRRLRMPFPAIVAAFASAAVFAIMHGYMAVQLVLVGVLGLMFAIIRETRGSLIGCMTVHCFHNTVVISLVFLLLSQLND